MTTIKVPNSKATLNRLFLQLAATKDVADWTLAAIIYAWTTTDSFEIDRSAIGGFTAAPGFKSNAAKVYAYREAYEVAISEGLVKPLVKGDPIVVPSTGFSSYVEGSQWKIKARANAKPKARSRQQENLERDGHKTSTIPKPAVGHAGARVATVRENVERSLQELEVALKKVTNPTQKSQIELAKMAVTNALNTFEKANA